MDISQAVYEMTESNTMTPSILWFHVLILSTASVGLIETIKSWRKAAGYKNGVRKLIIASTLITTVSAAMQMVILFDVSFCHPIWGWFYNMVTLGVAVVKFGHTALVAVPNMLIDKLLGGTVNAVSGR